MTTQPLDLDAIEARAQAATPGPWEEHPQYGPHFYAYLRGPYLRGVGTLNFGDGEDAEADREFVKHAREDVDAMAAEIRRLRAELATASARLNATARLAGRLETKLRKLDAPATVDLHIPPAEGPEYTPCTACSHIEPDHRPDAGPCLVCGCGSYRPTGEETHVVADDSDDPEHVDDCPGCTAAHPTT